MHGAERVSRRIEDMATTLPDNPSGKGRRHDVDQFIAANLAALRAEQAAHLAEHGRYLQTLSPVAAAPTKGQRGTPDWTRKPTDGTKTLKDLNVYLPTTFPCAVALDTYDGPSGKGWQIRVEVIGDDGKRYVKIVNEGPETWRAHDWREVSDVTP